MPANSSSTSSVSAATITMAASLAIGLRTAFIVLACVTTATFIYTLATDGLPFREELLTPWMVATLIDCYVNIFAVAVWIVYKEANWIQSLIWIILLICFGSITSCAYIALQFLKLSPQESTQDPIYFVLLKNKKRNETESKSVLSVISARIVFSVLGCLILATLAYTNATDGSPFRPQIYSPWLTAKFVDFYVNFVALAVWIAYKEANWKTSTIWIMLLILGSPSTCIYIVLQLFRLSPQDPTFLVLFSNNNNNNNNNNNRAKNGYGEALLDTA